MSNRLGTSPAKPDNPLILAQVYNPLGDDNSPASLRWGLAALWKRRIWIVVGTLLCMLIGLLVYSVTPRVYQAQASLLVRPPEFSSELAPQPFSVETYRSILESDFIVNLVRAELEKRGQPRNETKLEVLKSRMAVKIYPASESEQPGERLFIPVIDLVVQAPDPDLSAEIANIWAKVFIDQKAGLYSDLKKGTLELIETQYPFLSESLAAKEAEHRGRQDHFSKALFDAEQFWNARILKTKVDNRNAETTLTNANAAAKTAFVNETVALVRDYESETNRLELNYLADWGREAAKEQIEAERGKLAEFKTALLGIDMDIQKKRDAVTELKKQVDAQPVFLTVSKSISDDALWNQVGGGDAGKLADKGIQDLKLNSQEVNPVRQTLMERLALAELDYNTALPSRERLEKEIEAIEASLSSREAAFAAKEIAYFDLEHSREAGKKQLEESRQQRQSALEADQWTALQGMIDAHTQQMADLASEKQLQIDQLNRLAQTELAALTREMDNARKTYQTIADKHQSVQLAKAEEDADVRIGALAIPPENPYGPGMALPLVSAALAGLIFSALLSLAVEFRSQVG